MNSKGVVTFNVLTEEEGGFSAHAKVGTWSLVTQGGDLDELQRMVEDLVQIYNSREARKITAYQWHFKSRVPVAA